MTNRQYALLWIAAILAFAPERASAASPERPRLRSGALAASGAVGLEVSIPVIGRLTGSGGILFKTALDVSNNTGTAAEIDFYLDGNDSTTQAPISVTGSISSAGALVGKGTGGNARSHSNYHSDDFVDSLVKAGMLSPATEADGFLGSVLLVFNGFSEVGQGTASANFYRTLSAGDISGTIGVSATGHEITVSEPTKLVGTFRTTLGKAGPQVYSNLFINNVGLTPTGTGTVTAVNVQVSAYANSTGAPAGTPVTISGIAPGETVVLGNVLTALGVPATEDTILVYVTVTSGTATIEGLAVEVDNGTHDSSSAELRRADF